MSNIIVLVHEISLDNLICDIPIAKFREIGDLDWLLIFLCCVLLDQVGSYGCGVYEDVIYFSFSYIFLYNIHEILDLEVISLSVFGHNVAYIDNFRIGVMNSFAYPIGK